LGHTPFGHAGERVLDRICPGGFRHQEQSVRVVEILEKNGRGLNLTKEVRDGIRNHSTAGNPSTLEGKIVRICDKIAYVNSDIDDAIRGKIIKEEEIPKEFTDVVGTTLRERLNTLIHDMISNSIDKNDIVMSEEKEWALKGLRAFMFERVYVNSAAKAEEGKAEYMIEHLFEYYIHHVEELPEEYVRMIQNTPDSTARIVCDFIAGMTDRYAVMKYQNLTIPRTWSVF
jgi:dGTPase